MAEPSLQLLARERRRIGLRGVDVDGEGELLGQACRRPCLHEVDAGLVRIGVAEWMPA